MRHKYTYSSHKDSLLLTTIPTNQRLTICIYRQCLTIKKRFCDINVGMSGSMNDTNKFRSTFYHKANQDGLFNIYQGSQEVIKLYLLGDKGYPLLPWIMIPHKYITNVPHTLIQSLFNKQKNVKYYSQGHKAVKKTHVSAQEQDRSSF